MAQYDHKTQVQEVATAYGVDLDAAATMMNDSGARINSGSYGFMNQFFTYSRSEKAATDAAYEALIEAAPSADVETGTEAASEVFTVKHSSVYGTGRVYADQAGATQYDNGSGRHTVQIWDN